MLKKIESDEGMCVCRGALDVRREWRRGADEMCRRRRRTVDGGAVAS